MTGPRAPVAVAGVLVALGLLGSGCTLERREPVPPPGVQARAEVLAELRSYYADLSDRDWPAFASHFWPGATIGTVWQPPGEQTVRAYIQTIQEFIDQAPQGPGSREIFSEELVSAEIRVSGSLAQAWVRYRARFGDPEDVAEWEGIDAFSLLLVDGRWKIASLAFAAAR